MGAIWLSYNHGSGSVKPAGRLQNINRATDSMPCRTVRTFGPSAAMSGHKRPKEREGGMEPSPSFSRWWKWAESGCWRGAGGWMGPASDLRQKECPRLLSRPAPLAALHTVISTGAFVFTFQTPNSRAEATDQHTATPRSPCCCTVHYNLTAPASLAPSKSHLWRALLQSSFSFLLLATKMLIAPQSQSLKSLTYCVDNIPLLLQPFMWMLMYCHLPALWQCVCEWVHVSACVWNIATA